MALQDSYAPQFIQAQDLNTQNHKKEQEILSSNHHIDSPQTVAHKSQQSANTSSFGQLKLHSKNLSSRENQIESFEHPD